MLSPLSEKDIRAKFGNFTFHENPKQRGAILIDPPWEAESIGVVTIPELAGVDCYGKPFSGKVRFHKLAAPSLKAAFAEIGAQGLKDRIISYDGSWVPRHKTWEPKRSLSSHSWGIAIDINARWNGYNAPPPPKGAQGSVRELVAIMESQGFAWGGDFHPADGMHFEFAAPALVGTPTIKGIALRINGQTVPGVTLTRDTAGRTFAVAGELLKALGITISASERAVKIPLRIFMESQGYTLTGTDDGCDCNKP